MGTLSWRPSLLLYHQLEHQPPLSANPSSTHPQLTLSLHFNYGSPKSLTTAARTSKSAPSKARRRKQQNPRFRTNKKNIPTTKPKLVIRNPRGQKSLATIYADLKFLCREGQLEDALSILSRMDFRTGEIPVDSNIYDFLLDSCTIRKFLEGGKQVHEHMKLTFSDQNIYLATKLVRFYTECGNVVDAQKAFDAVRGPKNMFLWNSLIRAYVKTGFYEGKAIELYDQMRVLGSRPDSFTFSCLLKVCGSIRDLAKGMEIHGEVVKSGLECDAVVGGALVDMYCRCDCVEFAWKVFEKIPDRNVVSWSAMVSGFVHNSCWEDALECFAEMVYEGSRPNSTTVSSVLPACGVLGTLRKGKEIHGYAIRNKFDSSVFVGSALIDMHTKCGCVEYANRVFDNMAERNVVSYSAMIVGYQRNGKAKEAFEIFRRMQGDDVKPNLITMVNVLPACGDLAALQQGKQIHAYVIKNGFSSNLRLYHELIDMYFKCESVEDGSKVFDEIPEKGVSSWTTMIAAYKRNGNAEKALTVFDQMRENGVKPNLATMLKAISACSQVISLQEGKKIHAYAIKSGFESHSFVCSALIGMYTNCGFSDFAAKLFRDISEKGVVSWTAIIEAYAINGSGEKALELFNAMQQEDVKPNQFTFTALLTACSNAGLVAEGWQYFDSMDQVNDIQIKAEHYACMVDLLGRIGQLNEAKTFIENMPIKPDASVWRTLLGASRNHCNVEIGEYAVGCLQELKPLDTEDFVALASIYAAAGKWDNVAKVREKMKNRGLKGRPEWSGIVVKNRFHTFIRGDKTHPQLQEIYVTFERFAGELRVAGYIPESCNVLHLEKDDGDNIFCGHTVILALTFGLMNLCPGTIWIVQNLHMCRICHNVTKAISKITGKKIIVRDIKCIHHFSGGECSCKNYW